ncbi:trophoblast-specific protein alpha [Phodopus roborovskii]|uniref:trophoblast-specific protein alpha n=1 Tax=Phodopus roborovskii TaxID=109678 RepID=UPI0021E4844E|nr:trophoblast-specific protein alpha [Phodopus roborovskii]
MTPAVLLVILGLTVASAAESPDPSLDAEQQEQPIENKQDKDGFRRQIWEEFMKQVELYNKKTGQKNDSLNTDMEDFDDLVSGTAQSDDFSLEMEDFDDLTDDEFKNMVDKVLFPMFGEEKGAETQADDVPQFGDLTGSDDMTPVQDQV